MTRCALTIAGFDPSGGAGISADLRVFAGLGVAGLSVSTALTVQNSRGVQAVHPVGVDILEAQLEALFSDAAIAAVKIGMLAGADQVRAAVRAIERFRPPHVILDPVLSSTGGVPLLDGPGRSALVRELLPLCGLVMPNLPEAAALTGLKVARAPDMAAAGERLLRLGAGAVLIKGGHRAGRPTDILYRAGVVPTAFVGARVATIHAHGTGCLLSSATASYLALGFELEDSIRRAKNGVSRALETPVVVGGGRGYPDILAAARADVAHARRLAGLNGLYAVTDESLRPGRSPEKLVRAALAGGANVVQLRAKGLGIQALVRLAKRLNRIAHARGALFIVNDRVDAALAADADGVHLGPEDMPPADARRILGGERLIGVSVGTVREARLASPHASYFGVGAIFGSKTKSDAGPPVGLRRLREIGQACPGRPLVAIGGIDAGNIEDAARAGAAAAAVVSAIAGAADVTQAARRLAAGFASAANGRAAGAPI